MANLVILASFEREEMAILLLDLRLLLLLKAAKPPWIFCVRSPVQRPQELGLEQAVRDGRVGQAI